jgi:hypothetical protein
MSKNNVTYNADHREIAKDTNCRLFTIQWTGKGGGGQVCYQGPADDASFAIIEKAFHDLVDLHAK